MIYDTTKVKDTFNITLDWILSRVSEYDYICSVYR